MWLWFSIMYLVCAIVCACACLSVCGRMLAFRVGCMLTRIRGFHGTAVYEFVCVMAAIMRRPTPPSAPCHHANAFKADQSAPPIIFVQLMSFLHRWGGGENNGSSHLTGPHVLLRCPLACPNSAPWCLICTLTLAPPSLCLCSLSSARFHNRGGMIGELFPSLRPLLENYFPLLLFLFTVCFSLSRRQFHVSPPCFYQFLDIVILFSKSLCSEVTEMSEFRGSSASLPFSQWLISSYLDQRD